MTSCIGSVVLRGLGYTVVEATSPFVAAAFSVMVIIIIVRFVVVVSLQTRYEQYCIEQLAAT
jgi:hypothetical protein